MSFTFFPPGSAGTGGGSGTSVYGSSRMSLQGAGSSTVTVDLNTTGVTAASSYNSLTVDAFGRVTAAQVVVNPSSGTSLIPTSVFSFQVGASNVTLDLPALVTAGSYNSVNVDKYGRVTAAQLLGYVTSSGTSITITSNLSKTVGSSNITLDLSTTGVAAGSYTSVTVDAFGRVTAAANPGFVTSSGTSVTATSAFSTQVGSSNITLDLPALVTAGSYNSVNVDKYGRVTVAQLIGYVTSSGTSFTGTSAISLQVGSTTTIDLSATGVTAGSYVTVSVDNRGRVTGGSTSLSTAQVTGTWTSDVSAANVWASTLSAPSQRSLKPGTNVTFTDGGPNSVLTINASGGAGSAITFWEAMSFTALRF